MYGCPKIFVGDFDMQDPSIEARASINEQLRYLVDSLLLPLLNRIADNRHADMDIMEHITMAILPIINVINKASRLALLSIEQYSDILNSLLSALLRRAASGGIGRSQNSTEFYRGCLCCCIAHLLRYGMSSKRSDEFHARSMRIM
jgi:hypothetical protein